MVKLLKNEELTPEILRTLSSDEISWIYNALDCCVTAEVAEAQLAELTPEAAHTAAFSHALMAPIFEMNLRGVLIDESKRQAAVQSFQEAHDRVAKNLTAIVEEGIGFKPFNYRSSVQLKKLLYTILQLPPVRARNASGRYAPTTNRDALEKLQKHWRAIPLCRHLITLREIDKKLQFLTTDLDDDGRMRTSYNIAGTNTGRLSSAASDYGTGTNQQNVERKLREMFVPDPGMKFCNVDLEQADARNVGAICWENFVETCGESIAGAYLDATESGDLHTAVCRMAWTDLDWPTDRKGQRTIADGRAYRDMSYRDLAKRLGHGTNYYGTPRTMALHAKVEVGLIETFQRKYFTAFPVLGHYDKRRGDDPDLPTWHGWVRTQIGQFGHITTPHFNRRRYFFGRPDDDRTLREAIAYAPQSMTADQIDQGIINLWRSSLPIHLLIQVHDSILFQYPEEMEAEIIPAAMELLRIRIPLKKGREFHVPVEAKIGWNWNDEDEDNPSGLIKWKGPGLDLRERPVIIPPSSSHHLKDLLHGAA